MTVAASMRLGVLVPCRNEVPVLERRLRNLALSEWPASEQPHRIVVVDDQSFDGTPELAERLCADLFEGLPGVTAHCVSNDGPAGKAGALRAGLAELQGVELVVLTDADVVHAPPALGAFVEAFRADPRLAMASGVQSNVSDLRADGTVDPPSGPRLAPWAYARWSEAVRRLESRFGKLFSVHGQLLAWRASLELEPRSGVAADDLDLMVQARAQGGCVRLVEAAQFFESPPVRDHVRDAQAVRRARAYVQWARNGIDRSGARFDRWDCRQFALYRWLPRVAPWLALTALVLIALLFEIQRGPRGLAIGLALVALVASLPPGRAAFCGLWRIAQAMGDERREAMGDTWETLR